MNYVLDYLILSLLSDNRGFLLLKIQSPRLSYSVTTLRHSIVCDGVKISPRLSYSVTTLRLYW